MSALLLGGPPGSGAATDSHHGSRFRSDTDLCSPKHAIHCLLHHRLWPRPDCHWYHRHRYNCGQPTRSAITPPPRSPCTPAAKRAFAATARPALAKGTSNSAIVSHRLLPSATRQVGALAAPTAARSLEPQLELDPPSPEALQPVPSQLAPHSPEALQTVPSSATDRQLNDLSVHSQLASSPPYRHRSSSPAHSSTAHPRRSSAARPHRSSAARPRHSHSQVFTTTIGPTYRGFVLDCTSS